MRLLRRFRMRNERNRERRGKRPLRLSRVSLDKLFHVRRVLNKEFRSKQGHLARACRNNQVGSNRALRSKIPLQRLTRFRCSA